MLGQAWTLVGDYVRAGGYVMPFLVVATLVLWFAIGFRASLLGGAKTDKLDKIIVHARRGGAFNPRNPVERTVHAAIAAGQHRGARHAIDELLLSLRQDLNRYRTTIRVVVMVAPVLGLLGTVTGMIETFASLGQMALYTQSGGIAGGISQALFTTQLGLAIAIPGLVLQGALERQQNRIEIDMRRLRDNVCGRAA